MAPYIRHNKQNNTTFHVFTWIVFINTFIFCNVYLQENCSIFMFFSAWNIYIFFWINSFTICVCCCSVHEWILDRISKKKTPYYKNVERRIQFWVLLELLNSILTLTIHQTHKMLCKCLILKSFHTLLCCHQDSRLFWVWH